MLYISSRCRAAVEVVGTQDSRKEIDAVNGDDADEEVDGARELTEEVRGVFVHGICAIMADSSLSLTSSAVSSTFRFDNGEILRVHVTG